VIALATRGRRNGERIHGTLRLEPFEGVVVTTIEP
jgi:hypothetical protein